jgi:hypothetical protein
MIRESDMTITDDRDADHHRMRAACPDCGSTDGTITTVSGQDTVRCAQCNRYCYNAPRTETGAPRRSLRSRPQISPSQRQRILVRDNRTCFVCCRREGRMQIGHIISLHEGRAYGLSDAELFHDENLVAMCPECNAGQRSETLPLPFLVAVLRAHGCETLPLPFLVTLLRVRIAKQALRL